VQGFARALQSSGYATDPKYAEKLVQVIGRVNTLA
jgi:flagellum-specific peptidoglycan hydrolase FlgJ